MKPMILHLFSDIGYALKPELRPLIEVVDDLYNSPQDDEPMDFLFWDTGLQALSGYADEESPSRLLKSGDYGYFQPVFEGIPTLDDLRFAFLELKKYIEDRKQKRMLGYRFILKKSEIALQILIPVEAEGENESGLEGFE
jgi:hypothetical protein